MEIRAVTLNGRGANRWATGIRLRLERIKQLLVASRRGRAIGPCVEAESASLQRKTCYPFDAWRESSYLVVCFRISFLLDYLLSISMFSEVKAIKRKQQVTYET
jgi:hypothetical protein